jgi:predicted kinase
MAMDELIKEFRSRLVLPARKAAKPFLLGIIGNLSSGKSTLARMLATKLPGSVVITADSARFLLKEQNMPWGDNVRTIVRGVAEGLLKDGYAIILDGSSAELKEREQTAELVSRLSVPVLYIRIKTSYETSRERLKAKYDDQSWQSSFERSRIGLTDKMLINLDERRVLHDALKDEDIVGLVETFNNDGSQAELEQRTGLLAEQVLQSLE